MGCGSEEERAVVGVWWEQGFWNAEWASGDGFRILIAWSWVGKKSDVWACCQGMKSSAHC